MLLFDRELRILIADGPELVSFDTSPATLEGLTIDQAFSAELAAELRPRYLAALAGSDSQWERKIEDRLFSLTAAPVRTEAGEVFAGMVIAREVTEQRRNESIWRALHEIATAVARNTAPDVVADQIARQLRTAFAVDTAAVVRFTDASAGEIIAMYPPRPPSVPRHIDLRDRRSSAAAQVAATGEASVVGYEPGSGEFADALRGEGLRAGASAPIRVGGQLWGAVSLGSSVASRLTAPLLNQLASFAELVEIALGNLDAWTVLTAQAATDSLTGLANRRTLERVMEVEVERANGSGAPLSVVLLDIDHFKRINDGHGHAAGDLVLTEVARRLASVSRAAELVGRLGGEEFLWVLPDTTAEQAIHAAERARLAIASEPFEDVGEVTVSTGVCALTEVDTSTDLLSGADIALYQAKRQGRNRTACFHQTSIG